MVYFFSTWHYDKIITLTLSFILITGATAQTTALPTTSAEQQMENNTENNADAETEDDDYLQQMQQYIKDPINLNTADESELRELKLLTPLQIENFVSYRNLLGRIISVYELQAVPTWSVDVIEKLLPYIIIGNTENAFIAIKNRVKNGEHSLLVRVSQILQRSKGYLLDSSSTHNYYAGSPQKILVRYKYQYKNLLQYGIIGEKDAGEQFFRGKQKNGFDFYSAHFFVKNVGNIKALALGDFTVNLGQGLTQWQNLAFKKGGDVLNIKRESAVLRPYNSAGEINFHRGTGITIARHHFETTAFASHKKTDANLVTDSFQTSEDYISSLQISGYHRTKSEMADKGIQHQVAFGGNISYKYRLFHLGLNAIQYKFKLPIDKGNEPYNIYALKGSALGNYSFDYSYTFKNLHFFGEAAASNNGSKGFINALLVSIAANADMSLVYRNLSPGYQSLYSNAFTENTNPANEKGLYIGLSMHPAGPWKLDAYADFYKIPWLKFRVDGPSAGQDYLVQLTYKPNKQLEVFSRFHFSSQSVNFNPDAITLSPITIQPRQNWRSQFSFKISPAFTIKSRVEMVWLSTKNAFKEQGFLYYIDVNCKPQLRNWSGNIRLLYFETDSYNTRLYAFENDVLYSYSIPVFYNKGVKSYININSNILKKITIWCRVAQTVYAPKTVIGSGLDEINGRNKTEIKLQLLYKF